MNFKKTFIFTSLSIMTVAVVAATTIATTSCQNANANDTRSLPTPTKSAKMTLMESL